MITASKPLKETSFLSSTAYQKLLSFLMNHKSAFAFEVSDRKYLLYTVDLFLVLSVTFFYNRTITAHFTPGLALYTYWPWFLAVTVYWSFFSYIFDLYSLEKMNKIYTTSKFVLVACILTVACYVFFPWYTPALSHSRLTIGLYLLNFSFFILSWRYIYFRTLNKPLFLKRVVILGSGWPSKALVDVFADGDIFNYHLGYKVVGIIDDAAEEITYKGVRIIQHSEDLPKLIKRLKIDEIIVNEAVNKDNGSHFLRELTRCRMKGISVTSLADFYENLTGRVLINGAGQDFYLAFPYNKNNLRTAYLVFSRIIDITFGFAGVILCLLVVPFLWLANIICSKGPLLYSQERVGLYGRKFNIVKFRSMVVDAEKNGAAWAQKNDCRVTTVGRFLRSSRIDELPQAWSVLKGDMSLIGPRPERPMFVEQLKQEIPFYDTRHLAKPGITGWAQAIYKYGSNAEDAVMKVQYDLYYLKNRSFLLDIKVILKTISVVVRFKGV